MHLSPRIFFTVTATLFHVAGVAANATDSGTNDTKNTPITLILKDFLTWPARALFHDNHPQKRRLKTRRRVLQSDYDVQLTMDTRDALSTAEGDNAAAAATTLPPDIYFQVDGNGHNASIQTQTALPPPPLTLSECLLTFTALNFDVRNFDRYPEFFHDDSVLVLPQAGRYKGAADIEEYMRFASDTSPFILNADTVGGKFMVHSFDPEARTCSYLVYNTALVEMDSTTAQKSSLLRNVLFKLTYAYNEDYFSSAAVLLTPKYLTLYFGTITNTDQTRNKICEISEGCKDVNVGLTREECVSKLRELPITTNGLNFDGKSQGCHVLHSAFALTNDKHCPHLSFEPLEDSKGKVKCQTSENIQVSDHFDDLIVKDFYDWLDSPASLTESTDGYKILSLPTEKTTTFWVIVGLVAPAFVGILTFGVLYCTEKADNKNEEEPRGKCRITTSRPLFILIGTMLLTVIFAFATAGAIITFVAHKHPEWKYTEPSNPMQESYLEGVGKYSVVGTSPQTLLTDAQFQVYMGFIAWLTVVIAGLGLEIFVWYHFLDGNVWDDTKDGMWKFAQFIFPVLLMTTLGLAATHNYLAFIILVPALWKFGFPETLTHLYLGVFNKKAHWVDRAGELCDGFGTLLHHSAASFIISMLVVGVFPPTRHILNPCLLLVMQHWIALLKYVNVPLYSAIELILEYFFEWIVLSDWAQLYHLHWTAALGASIMLVAHWLYLFSAGFAMLSPSLEDKVGGEIFGRAMLATSVKNSEKFGDVEDEDLVESNEQLNCDHIQTEVRRTIKRNSVLGLTTPTKNLDEEEAFMGGGRRRSLLRCDKMQAQRLVLALVANDEY